jgi:hypothetical protein
LVTRSLLFGKLPYLFDAEVDPMKMNDKQKRKHRRRAKLKKVLRAKRKRG